MVVRRLIFGMGYRYRLHATDLPGRPDIVFRGRGKVIFVHGCFWHRHEGCALARMPKSRLDFWLPKLEANKQRDKRNKRRLALGGWKVLTIWECQLKNASRLQQILGRFLDA
jgi:DNA mismatch endonuclease, patch repair protein